MYIYTVGMVYLANIGTDCSHVDVHSEEAFAVIGVVKNGINVESSDLNVAMRAALECVDVLT